MNHFDYMTFARKNRGVARDCSANDMTFGGRCFNCGFDPARCHRAETKRDCPLNHRWSGKEARHR